MSATITWRPMRIEKVIETGAPQNFLKMIGGVGRYSSVHINYLRGLEAMKLEGVSGLIEAIKKYGEVIVEAEY